jgi:hypothetical protein
VTCSRKMDLAGSEITLLLTQELQQLLRPAADANDLMKKHVEVDNSLLEMFEGSLLLRFFAYHWQAIHQLGKR